jgi:hypothetical protein
VTNVLGVIGIFFFIASVIALAAAVTWIVVKVSPTKEKPTTGPSPNAEETA